MLRNPNHPRIATDEADPAVVEGLGPPIALFKAFARRPDRARAIQGWGRYYLSRQCALTLRHRELVIDRTTALHARNDLTDDEWAALVAAVGDDGALDLMLVCGWYHAISYVARAGRLAPEPGSPTFTG